MEATDYRLVEQEICRESDPSISCILKLQEIIKEPYFYAYHKLNKNNEEEEEEEDENDEEEQRKVLHLLTNYLPFLLKQILKKKINDKSLKEEIVTLMKYYIKLIIIWSPFDVTNVIKMLMDIFQQDSKLFQEIHKSSFFSRKVETDIEGEYTCSPKYSSVSPYYLLLIDYFGENRGFEIILERIANKANLMNGVYYLTTVEQIRRFLKPSFLSNYSMKLKDTLFSTILSMNPEELKQTPKQVIINSTESLYYILSTTLGCEEAGRITEIFQLDLAEKCFYSPILEKRLFGLKTITSFISMSQRKESQASSFFINSKKKISTKWLETEYLVNWIEEKKVVDELFGIRMHHELLTRCCDIFIFFTIKNRLKTDHLKMIWNSSQDKQDITVDALYDIIKELIPYLKMKYLEVILEFIQSFPVKNYNSKILSLAKQFTEYYVNKNEEFQKKMIPLTILWNVIQDNSGVSEDVFLETTNCLKELFYYCKCDELNYAFIEKCIENISSHTSVPQSLILLQKILDLFPEIELALSNSEDGDSIMDKLRYHYKIVDLFFDDLEKYKSTCNEIVQKNGIENINSSVLIGKYFSHISALQTRLDFLQFLISHCPLSITESHINVLWKTMITTSLTNEERNLAFTWLTETCNQYLFEQSIIDFVFQKKLCELDFDNLGETEFRCFEIFFRFLNVHLDKILNLNDSGNRFQVLDFDLIGLDSFWSLTLHILDPNVANQAMCYLKTLYNSLCVELLPKQVEIREEFIKRVMQKLKEANSLNLSVGVDKAEFRIMRCIILLQKFVDPSRAFPLNSKRSVEFTKLSISGEFGNYQVLMKLTDTYGDFVQKLINKFVGASSENKTIQTSIKGVPVSLNEYSTFIEDLQLAGITIGYKVVSKEKMEKQLKKQGDDTSSAKFILSSNSEFFNQLFSIMDYSEDISDKVWDLLDQIPVNPEMKVRFKKIGESTNWNDLLSTHSTYKLLYSLQIIESIATECNESRTEEEDQKLWCNSFVSTGGFKQIYNIFLNNSESVFGRLKIKCLEFLLKLINIFLLSRHSIDDEFSYIKEEFINWIDSKVLMNDLLDVIWLSSRTATLSNSKVHGDLVNHATTLLLALLYTTPQLLSEFFNYPNLNEFIKCVMLETSSKESRKVMSNAIISLCSSLPSSIDLENQTLPLQYFIPLFYEFVKDIPPSSQFCTEFFETLITLLKENDTTNQKLLNYQKFANEIIDYLMRYPIIEKEEEIKNEKDFVFIGLANLLNAIFSISLSIEFSKNELMKYLFVDCLFTIPTSKELAILPPKCKSKEARKAAFDLLKQLIDFDSSLLEYQLQLINDLHLSDLERDYEWGYSPSSEQRSLCGYVGIKNLGCICYMNSLLQQLYMMPKFRKGILTLDEFEDTEESPKLDSIIYQLQIMFSYLQESQKQYYNPIEFCRANKDYDGNPTDVRVQMDVDEFFNMLCDKLDMSLKATRKEKLLKNIWCGNVCTQFICKECNCVSERDEPFYTISLDIKNKNDIEEALNDYVKGEMLEGDNAYMCEKCDKKVDALMRRCIKNLPNTMIILLKRFEFNFDTMRKLKLNDYCGFPTELNMMEFTKEGIAKKDLESALREGKQPPNTTIDENPHNYYQYNLVGILVHVGHADSGHYYSFIKERNRSNTSEKEARWFEFNDDVVRSFDPSLIEQECFGGSEVTTDDVSGAKVSKTVSKARNAYMLFYERVEEINLDNDDTTADNDDNPQNQNQNQDSSDCSRDEKGNSSSSSSSSKVNTCTSSTGNTCTSSTALGLPNIKSKQSVVPKDLFNEVWEENIQFFMDQKIFDQDYFLYLHSIIPNSIKNIPLGRQCSILQICSRFAFNIISRSKEKEVFTHFMENLTKIYVETPSMCYTFLEDITRKWINSYFFDCPTKDIRFAIAKFIGILFTSVSENEDVDDYVQCLPALEREIDEYSDSDSNDEDDDSNDGDDEDDDNYSDDEDDEDEEGKPLVIRVMDKFYSFWRILPSCWRTLPQFFSVFKYFAEIDSPYREYLLRKGFIIHIHDLVHRVHKKEKRLKNNDVRITNPSIAFQVLDIIIRSSNCPRYKRKDDDEDEDEDENEDEDEDDEEEDISDRVVCPFEIKGRKIDIPFEQIEALRNLKFLKAAVQDERNAISIANMLKYWSWQNLQNTNFILRVLKNGVHSSEYNTLEPWFKVVDPYLTLLDEYTALRVEVLLSSFIATAEKFKKYPKYTKAITSQLKKLKKNNDIVDEWADDNYEKWSILKDIQLYQSSGFK